VQLALSRHVTQLEHRLLCKYCRVVEEVLECVVPSKDGKCRTRLCLDQDWICQVASEGPLSQITPCCFLLGVSLLLY